MSPDGNTVAVGIVQYSSNLGRVAVYKYSGSSWGSVVNIDTTVGSGTYQIGNTPVFNNDGTLLVTGCSAYNSYMGCFEMWKYESGSWVFKKQFLNPTVKTGHGTDTGEFFGGYLSMDYAGTSVIVSNTGNDVAGADYGRVVLYGAGSPPSLTFDGYNKLTAPVISVPDPPVPTPPSTISFDQNGPDEDWHTRFEYRNITNTSSGEQNYDLYNIGGALVNTNFRIKIDFQASKYVITDVGSSQPVSFLIAPAISSGNPATSGPTATTVDLINSTDYLYVYTTTAAGNWIRVALTGPTVPNPVTTVLTKGSDSYDIGTASSIYIDATGTYDAQAKNSNTFVIKTSNVVSGTVLRADRYGKRMGPKTRFCLGVM